MLVNKEERDVTLEEIKDEDTIECDIDDSEKAVFFEILRSKIYSMPLLAVCRETLSNAKDANVEAGWGELAIQVHLPCREEPYFEVQDGGLGMSPSLIRDVYAKLGKSTKTADAGQIGGFGFGSTWPLH